MGINEGNQGVLARSPHNRLLGSFGQALQCQEGYAFFELMHACHMRVKAGQTDAEQAGNRCQRQVVEALFIRKL
ncbi:hypothetical protein D3C87_1781980 [compost metagenome]